MAITRKPHPKPAPAVDVEELINRGGSPTGTESEKADSKATPILLRIPSSIMEQLDTALKARPIRLPRHTWILEAIHEKLLRELPSREGKI